MKPRLIIEQKITAFVNRYEIYSALENGEKSELLAFAQQRRLAFKERVDFYTDEVKSDLVFSFRAEKVMDLHGKFFIEDADGNRIGAFKKQFKQSLLNSTWSILDLADTITLTVKESNQTLATIRRFGGWIPIIGDIIELIVLFFRYHFMFVDQQGSVVGTYTKTKLIRDHYQLDMSDEQFTQHDWRVLAAMAVALDALQSR
ncbi:MAG: hypothetical protein EOP52_14175 [Sphingobacteriales bacterium]|nr:MAG: hypothetical protein EOP52_14175 [Sphingobacteriales bacterium]